MVPEVHHLPAIQEGCRKGTFSRGEAYHRGVLGRSYDRPGGSVEPSIQVRISVHHDLHLLFVSRRFAGTQHEMQRDGSATHVRQLHVQERDYTYAGEKR